MSICADLPSVPYGEFSRRLHAKVAGKRIPLSGSIELTYRCNLGCAHCYLSSNRMPGIAQDELTTAEIHRILAEISDAGCLWILFTGGEPFLRPDLFDLLKAARQRGLLVNLFSNGTMLTEEKVARLADWPPFCVEITLYGLTQATYERVTGSPGSHARCMRGIELLQAKGIPFKLKSMVMTLNVHELEATKAFAESLNVGFRFDTMMNACLDGVCSPLDYRLSPQQILAIDHADQRRMEEWREFQKRYGRVPPEPELLYSCGAGINTFHIDPNGNLSVCMMSRKPAYNLRQGSFEEGWNTFLWDVRKTPSPKKTACSTCQIKSLCGQCPGWASLEMGDSNEPVDFLCQVAHLRATSYLSQAP